MAIKIGSGLVPFSTVVDRFLPEGYRTGLPFAEQLSQASQVPGLDAIGLDYPAQFADAAEMKALLDANGLSLCTLEMGVYCDRKWKNGSFTSTDPGLRREALELVKRGLEIAAELGAPQILFWPGQDGFEYPFQADYRRAWAHLVEGLGEVAAHRPDVKIGIEYKPKEPRVRCHLDTAAKALLLCEQVARPNLGVVVDLGHALNAQENPAQAVALCADHGRLWQVHVNDNYGDWDSDLLVGQVNFWLTLEFFYWLNRVGYEDYYLMDFFPYREDGPAALAQCIRNTQRFADLAARLAASPIQQMQEAGDPVALSELLWQQTIRI
jgi:xylose isomerase